MPAEPVRRISITYQQPSCPESQVVVTEAPITPPLSPKSIATKSGAMPVEEMPICSSKPIQIHSEQEAMDVESAPVHQHPNTMPGEQQAQSQDQSNESQNRPQRCLEDQRVRLQGSGLKLSDFEVRGTLGKFIFGFRPIIPSSQEGTSYRHRDVWEGTLGAP